MWRDQFNRWSHIDSRDLYVFTSKAIPDNFAKRSLNDSVVLIVRLGSDIIVCQLVLIWFDLIWLDLIFDFFEISSFSCKLHYYYYFCNPVWPMCVEVRQKTPQTTYSMISFKGQRGNPQVRAVMEAIKSREWGLVLLDEVHVAPATIMRTCLSITNSR